MHQRVQDAPHKLSDLIPVSGMRGGSDSDHLTGRVV